MAPLDGDVRVEEPTVPIFSLVGDPADPPAPSPLGAPPAAATADIADAPLGFCDPPFLRLRRLRQAAAGRDPELCQVLTALTNLDAFKDLTGWTPESTTLPGAVPVQQPDRPWRKSRNLRAISEALDVLFAETDSPLGSAYAFGVWKKDGTVRIVLDPAINDAPEDPFSISLPDFKAVKKNLSTSAYAITLDCVSYFNQFPLSRTISRAFCVRWGAKVLRYLRLPMGWRWAPFAAQHSLLLLGRLAGIPAENLVIWIDNICIHGEREQVENWHASLLRTFADFRVSVREEDRGEVFTFLGVCWDLTSHTASFLPRWRAKARDLVAAVAEKPVSQTTLQRVVGMCVWAHTLAAKPLVFLSHLLAHLAHVSRSDGPVLRIPSDALADIQATLEGLDQAFPLAAEPLPMHPLDLWTDSSSTTAAFVWAPPAVTLDVPVARAWKWDSDCHINLKELASLYVALLAQPGLRHVRIRWACDNSSCVDIVRQLHSRSPPMCAILREIVLLCRSRCIEILPEWVSTRVQLADGPSRSTVAGPYLRVFP